MSANVNDESREPKAAYQPPRLKAYGDVREITLAVGNQGGDDGGGAPNHKSSK